MTFDGETKIVSLGLMNHVFTIPEDEAKEAASDLLQYFLVNYINPGGVSKKNPTGVFY